MYKQNQALTIWGRGMYKPNQTPLPPPPKKNKQTWKTTGPPNACLQNKKLPTTKRKKLNTTFLEMNTFQRKCLGKGNFAIQRDG